MQDQDAKISRMLKRHAAFWRNGSIEGPLISVRRERPVLEHTRVLPEMIDVELFCRETGEALIQGDLFRTVSPFSAIPWMEAMCGCGIHSGTGEAMWPEPYLKVGELGAADIRERAASGSWRTKLIELTDHLVAQSNDTFLVTQTLQRGPMDILSALLGDEQMGLAFYDNPDGVGRILEQAAEIFIDVTKAQYSRIPDFHGGWAPWLYGVWAPGSVTRLQSDSSVQISPEMYSDSILPHERRIFEAFEYTIMDLHSSANLRLYRILMHEPALKAISVTIDPQEAAPTVEELIPTFLEILEHKALVIFGKLSEEEIDLLANTLPAHCGVCIHAYATR